MVGAAAAGVHLLTVLGAVSLAQLRPQQANIAGFACAFLVSHAGQRKFTFGAGRSAGGSMLRWLAVSLAGFGANQFLFVAALKAFPAVPYLALLAAVTLLVALASFALGKYWAFSAARRAA
nr:GtrA family protein [Pseudoduganella aquatica]